MEKFTTLTAVAAPFPRKNVDTDTIIRIERCTGTPKEELGQYAFEMARKDPDFVLDQPRYRDAAILVCGEFFGTGSSREMAVWALAGIGIRCLIAPSFGQIFLANCFQNGLLPIVLPAAEVDALMRQAEDGRPFEIDLQRQTVNGTLGFEIGARRKRMLLEGLDEVGLTLALEPRIAAFQAADRERRPWVYAGVSNAHRRAE
ncbi:MAG: 3-isopropylmalate dehydratase small subunit [Betaproteobacteria bacterium]|nr:3-isopropylmalate dehydratase small subunit [Betaproteobacteria bacterium]MDH5222087.1 3-isopropylmalate dehydratase small subunit [Betaproteobacteria bacterium]MDH5352294.1 3-isopropylmalate dehydratase small subunit [Betaproteobacteria bacterium]